MNKKVIGKFISERRNDNNLSQMELAKKIGVTEKMINRWENGKEMPEISLFKPLCKELKITVNDLISGKIISKDNYQEKLEDNIIDVINYSASKIDKMKITKKVLYNVVFGLLSFSLGLFLFPNGNKLLLFFCLLAIIFFLFSIYEIIKEYNTSKKIIIMFSSLVCFLLILFVGDYLNVKFNNVPTIVRMKMVPLVGETYYDSIFYDVVGCHDSDGSHYILIKNKKYTEEELYEFCPNRMISTKNYVDDN